MSLNHDHGRDSGDFKKMGAHTVAHGRPPSQRVRAARLQSWSAKGHRSRVTANSKQESVKSDPTNPDSAGAGHRGGP